MKRIKKFSMISSGAEAITESANVNQEAVMNLLNKMGYTSIDELKKEKNLLSKLEALVKEFDAKKDISEDEIEEDRAEDIEDAVKAKGTPRSLEGEEGDKEEDGEVGGSEDGEVAEDDEVAVDGAEEVEEVEEDKAKDVEDKEKDISTPKQLDDKAGEKVGEPEITDEVPAEADDETSGRKIKTFEEYIKEKELTINKNIKYHDDDEEPEDYAVPVAASAEPLAEDDDEEEGKDDEKKGDELEDKGDKKVDSEDDKEKVDHYKGAVKSDDKQIDALKKDVEYDEEEEEDAKKDESSKIMSFSNFVTEAYDKVVWGGDEGDKSKTHDGEDYEDDDEDDDKKESVEENVAEIITKIEGDELAGEEAGADGIAIPAVGGDGPETAAGIAGDMMDMGKPKSVEGKGKDLVTKDQEITEVIPGEKDEDKEVEGVEVSESETIKEKEITSDDEFTEYATEVLKSAHGDKFDEAKAKETIDGLLSKYDGDYGAAVGALQSSMG